MNPVGGERRALSHDEGPGSNSHSLLLCPSLHPNTCGNRDSEVRWLVCGWNKTRIWTKLFVLFYMSFMIPLKTVENQGVFLVFFSYYLNLGMLTFSRTFNILSNYIVSILQVFWPVVHRCVMVHGPAPVDPMLRLFLGLLWFLVSGLP